MRFAPAIAVLLALGHTAGGAVGETGKGLLSITFDDAARAQFDHGLRLAKAHGLVGTLFVPAGLIGDTRLPDGWTMTWDEVRAFHAAGWEIGAHGQHHERLPGLPPDRLAAEITEPIAAITAEIGEGPVSFSSPFGAFTDETLDRVMASYTAHLSWQGHGGRNPRDAIDPRFIGRLEAVNTMTAAEVCGEMVASARDGTWLVLLFHGITEGPPGDYEVSAAMMDEIFSCAAYLQARDVIEVKTVRDALAATGVAP
jgi:peptidoglycan/xylan/chitin deacetylase (PgdA/CDA1 family)